MIADAKARGMRVRGYVSVAFGCPYEGDVAPSAAADVAGRLVDLGCDEIGLGDTIGAATPGDVDRVLDAVLPVVPVERIGLHAHDTRGQALANVYAALGRGVTIVDSSAGGLGGCPFAGPGAVGNLATEDLVYFLDGLGIEHGASLEGVMAASAFIQAAVGHPLRSPTWLAGGRPVTPRPSREPGPARRGVTRADTRRWRHVDAHPRPTPAPGRRPRPRSSPSPPRASPPPRPPSPRRGSRPPSTPRSGATRRAAPRSSSA